MSLFDGGSAIRPDASMTGSIEMDGSVTVADGPELLGDAAVACMPKTCAALGFTCGMNNDGCGNPIDCGACTAPEFCGGGGYSKCGVGVVDDSGDGGYSGCTPVTCAARGVSCGPTGDGCGGMLDCGSCTGAQFCGGAGFGQCGLGLADGGAPCVPKTCASLGYDCGPAGDGCGGSLDCGSCTPPKYCGGGGFNTCGGNRPVLPDGGDAGNVVPCTPKTCADLGINCGPAGDGCGGALSCGTCSGLDICGGGGLPGVCGNKTPCNNLCQSQARCDGGTTTSITGKVLAGVSAWTGLAPDPVPNVLVYVPNSPVQPFTPGASCRQCGADVSGSPLVSTYTNFDGTFTLANVPAGANVPLVIQLGRWRRQFTVPTTPACATTPVGNLNLPRNQSEGDIPLTAISTGNVDPLECVLLKMGIDQAEFTPDSGTGRIHLYGGGALLRNGNGTACVPSGVNQCVGPGATAGPGTRQEPALLDGTNATATNYDQIMLPCWGSPITKTAAELANLIAYADAGGHFFATHYSYSWLVGNGEMNNVATWNPNRTNPGNATWTLNVSPVVPPSPPAPFTGTFVKWLNLTASLTNSGATVPANPQVAIVNARHDADGVANGSVDWIDGVDQLAPPMGHAGEPLVEHFTFNTPVGAASQCGHAIFSDFHVAGIANGVATNGQVFPNECTRDFTPQEKILEFMIWDLASCVPPPPAPTCTPLSCAAQNIGCGPAGNGCGGAIDCGLCPPGQQCGGNGVYGQCVPIPDGGSCQPQTCAQQKIGCGPAGDGCGSSIDCGPCQPPQTCGGAGVPGQCGGGCVPQTCAQQNFNCGPAGDGCGGLIQCGTCPPGQVCGGQSPGQCSPAPCRPRTCAELNINCGPAGDGCGGLLDCGSCTPPNTCGGAGVPGMCGGENQ
ncbi:MAG: hypothetical protein JOZ69_14340 [Myxococcales bacterium]|nr:hypothetical protein [Myxococcales bacterium]